MGYWNGLTRTTAKRATVALLIASSLFVSGTRFASAQGAIASGRGDVDCNGKVEDTDLEALIRALFALPDRFCTEDDVNRDTLRSAADVIAEMQLLRPKPGPEITFLGVSGSDGRSVQPLGFLEDGTIVYFRSAGFGFQIVVEAEPYGPRGDRTGTNVFNSVVGDPTRRPDLEIQVNRALGNGSRAVCDEFGIPAIDPPSFENSITVANTLNDLACRFRVATARSATCTQDQFEQTNFVAAGSGVQYCFSVGRDQAFPIGQTLVTVRVRDVAGNIGPVRRMMVIVENKPMPPTFTPLPPTATPTSTATRNFTRTFTRSPTHTFTRTRTPTASHTRSPTPSTTHTPRATPSSSATRFATPTGPPAMTFTRTPSGTPTATRSSTSARTATFTITTTPTTPTRTSTVSPTGTGPTTSTRTFTRTPTRTLSPERTSTPTTLVSPATATRTRTGSPTSTPTSAPGLGPEIVYFGVLRADDTMLEPSGTDARGIPIFERPFGFGFTIVVEARPGRSGAMPGTVSFSEVSVPDLQIQVNRAIGNGSAAVCDNIPPDFLGGVPAISPPSFADNPIIVDRLNDFGCRFDDGTGVPGARRCVRQDGCIRFVTGEYGCFSRESQVQFCGLISRTLEFQPGDTLVTVRVLDVRGNAGPQRQLIVRVP